MGKFGDSLKRELGKNTGKFVSNKVFGDGHSTPHRVSVSQQKKNAKLEAQLESERNMVAVEEAKLALEKKKLEREEAAKAAERRAEKIEKLKSEKSEIANKLKKEKQMGKQVELNTQVKKINDKIAQLTSNL